MKKKATSELEEIAGKLADHRRVRAMSVRTFLGLFGQERRGFQVVSRIRKELKKHKLATQPDFENENIDNLIKIVLAQPEPQRPPTIRKIVATVKSPTVPEAPKVPAVEDISTREPRNSVVTIRQGIPSAGKAPATVRPDETTKMALSRLMSEKLELLVVQSGDRARVEGVFSYASFTHAHMAGKSTKLVRDCSSREFFEVNHPPCGKRWGSSSTKSPSPSACTACGRSATRSCISARTGCRRKM